MNTNISISNQYFQEILSAAGYPLTTLSDLGEFALNGADSSTNQESSIRKNILDLVVWPSMREYYKWFPIEYIVEYSAEDSFEVDFPDPDVFCVVDVRLNTAGFGVRDSVNPFVNNSVYRAVNSTSSYGGGMYGTPYDYDMRQARIYDRAERQSIIDTNKAFRANIDPQNRKVKGFSNMMGKLVITWGKLSENFDKIPYNRLDEVIKLCKSNLLDHIGRVRGMQQSNLPNSFNYQLLLDTAKEWRKDVVDKWQKMSKIVIIRG